MSVKLILICLFMCPFASLAADWSPVGYWKTIDDISGEAKSIIHITKQKDETLNGRVMYIYPSGLKRCRNCSGDMKDKPVLGMVVMTKLRPSQDDRAYWKDGKIFNPRNGKTYGCNIRVIDNGRKLLIRGYIGLPLFGRSQTWLRVKKPV